MDISQCPFFKTLLKIPVRFSGNIMVLKIPVRFLGNIMDHCDQNFECWKPKICASDLFQPSEFLTCPVFRSPLYSLWNESLVKKTKFEQKINGTYFQGGSCHDCTSRSWGFSSPDQVLKCVHACKKNYFFKSAFLTDVSVGRLWREKKLCKPARGNINRIDVFFNSIYALIFP